MANSSLESQIKVSWIFLTLSNTNKLRSPVSNWQFVGLSTNTAFIRYKNSFNEIQFIRQTFSQDSFSASLAILLQLFNCKLADYLALPSAFSRPAATSKARQTTHGLAAWTPKPHFYGSLAWRYWYQAQTWALSFLGWSSSPSQISTLIAKGLWLQKIPLHLDLLPDTWVRSGTWSYLTCPPIWWGAFQFLFCETFTEIHRLGCMDTMTLF